MLGLNPRKVAGNVLIEYQNHANFSVREKTGKNDVVTEADEESNRQILAILQKVFPELKKRNGKRLRSEEVSDDNLKLSNSVEGLVLFSWNILEDSFLLDSNTVPTNNSHIFVRPKKV